MPLAPLAVRTLTPERLAEVRALVAEAADADGSAPLSEQFQLDLDGSGAVHLLVHSDGTLVGYAQLSDARRPSRQARPADAASQPAAGRLPGPAAELVVHPEHRLAGVGTLLLGALPRDVRIWSHGTDEAGRAFAAARGMRSVRELLVLARSLDDTGPALPELDLAQGWRIRPFSPGVDEAAWLATNTAAFTNHPEQGRLSLADLQARMNEPWFDPAGFLLIVPDQPEDQGAALPAAQWRPAVAAFHWTKILPETPQDGEVYVVGVHPAYQGQGLGRAAVLAGLHHLRDRGCTQAHLYVEADNPAALAVYEQLGFSLLRRETMFTRWAADGDATIGPMTAAADTRHDADNPLEAAAQPISAGVERRTPARGPGGRFVRSGEDAPDLAEPHARYLEREISWLQFNERVLQLAMDESMPLLERAKFLAIFSSNLDEFFMVRVAGLKRRIATGLAVRSAAGMEPRELLDRIQATAQDLMRMHSWVFWDQVRPALAEEGIHLVPWRELTEAERMPLHGLFREQIFPVLTPLAVDPAHPFPYISGLSLNLAVVLVNPTTGTEHFARVKVPPSLPRFLRVTDEHSSDTYSARFVALEELIAAHLDQLFTGMEVREHYTFRVTRNEDLEVEEDDAENLLTALEKELTRRRFGPPVRLEVEDTMDERVLDLLTRELGVTEAETYRLAAPLDLRGLFLLGDLDRSELKDPNFVPMTHPDLAPTERSQQGDIFAAVRTKDVLLHHPYDSFNTSVQAFIEQAAADPRVLAIKQTLYRTSGDSPIIDALIDASMAGKQVLAVVEIKARFDEVNNISWARKLEHAGVHVVYGIVGLKTHAKLCLVVRQEAEGLVRYCHIGTGNYNPKTARLYEDLGVLTCDPQVGEDLSRLFNQLSGIAPRSRFRRLLVAPRTVRSGLIEAVDDEIARHAEHGDGRIRLKMNSVVDEKLIDALYRASQAGVPVDVWVRGICAIRPGVPGLSENVRVRSTLGRFLEHSRIFWFAGGGSPRIYIGSADMMHRNLDRRVEALLQIVDPAHVQELTEVFEMGLADTTSRFELGADGAWTRVHLDAEGNRLHDVQSLMWDYRSKQRKRARQL